LSSPEETKQAADLIEHLLTDASFRAEFRRDPATACEKFGLNELAEELRGGSGAKALYTLELRQSMSSLAGVIMAAAAEGIGALELAGYARADDKRVAGVVNEALSRHSIKAISHAQMHAVDQHAPGHADHAGHEHEHGPAKHEPEHGAAHEEHGAAHHERHEPAHHDHGNGRHAPAKPHEDRVAPRPHEDHASLAKTPAVPHESHQDAPAPAPVHHEDSPAPVRHEDAPAPVQHEEPHAKPAAPHEPGEEGHDHGPSLHEAGGPAVAASDELTALLSNPNLELPPDARLDLESGRVDPRLVSVLTELTKEHKIGLSVVITGHDQFTSGGSVSNHFVGRGLDIARVDGEIVRSNSFKSRELAEALVDLPESIRPTEVGTPWSINAPGFFTDGGHQDHLHIAFDGAAPEGFKSPVAPAPAAAAAAASAASAAPAAGGAPAEAGSGVFKAASPNGGDARVQTVGAMPAAQPEPAAPQTPAQPAVAQEPAAAAAAVDAPVALPDVSDVYPGDDAPKEQIAAWMARQAHKAGLPGELPIMASLVESRLSNINYGDADSVGYFQMRVGIWDQGEYKGYGEKPELQLKWFIDHALHEKQKRVARGDTAFLKDSSKWGEWIADVERPAEQYRGRYQLRLGEARELLGSAQASAPPAAPDVDLDAAVAGAELDAAPQAKKALAIAKEYMGTPYQWGGATPETNFDCSGLMQWSYKQVGIDIPRVTYDQVNVGEHIDKVDDLEAGDLVFFQDSSGDMHHVGMYIGAHKFIHAPHTGDVVKVSSLDESYYQQQFAGGRRMVDAVPEAGAPAAAVAAVPGAEPGGPAPAAAAPAPRQSGVFAGVAPEAEAAKTPTIGAMRAAEQPPPAAAAVAEAVAAPVAPAPGAPMPPIAPEDMANTNEGGKLHGSEFAVHDAEGAPGPEGNLHAGYDMFARGGAPVRSPIGGTIVEVKASRGNTGQIFGGVVKVQGADGRVWVFRHVDPSGVVEGGKVEAGQQIASVTEWQGGSSHAHVELWKTLEGGYNVSNMEDPYVEFQKAYTGTGTEPPPDVHEPGGGAEHDHEGHSDEGGELAAAGPAAAPSAELEALLANPNLDLPGPARADLASGRVDPRLISVLSELTKEHKIALSVIITGHDKLSSSGSVSNHFVGRGLDIARVDGEIVRSNSFKSRELAEALVDLPESIRPTEVGTPWSINAPGFFTDGGHQDHLHIAFDDPPPEGFVSPAAPAAPAAPVVPAAPAPVAEAAVAAPETPAVVPPEPAAAPTLESGVFSTPQEADPDHSGNTVQFMRAVQDDVKAKVQQQPEPDLEVAKVASDASVGPTIDGYPGDEAPKEQIAAWMAARAQAAGLPPELPVMAALVESRLSNINFGDADSIGYFQMRTSIWDQGEYAGYGQDPEKQIKWFIDHAVHEKEKRLADGYTNFLDDESKWGDWVADVERPAEQYRGRYQERLAEARALLSKPA
jgi:cell wall-associated NlpC family hydrolase